MVNPLDPNAGSGGGLHHRFGGGPNSTDPLGDPTGRPLPAGRQKAPRAIKVPRAPKAAKQPRPARPPAPAPQAASSGGAAANRTPTTFTLKLRTPVFAPKTDSNPFAGAENPAVAIVFINPATGALFGLAGGHLFPLGHHPQATGKTSAQSRRAGPHIAEPTRATLLSYDPPSNTALVFPADQPDGQSVTVHVNPDIAPARLVAGTLLGITRLSDTDPTDIVATHVAQ